MYFFKVIMLLQLNKETLKNLGCRLGHLTNAQVAELEDLISSIQVCLVMCLLVQTGQGMISM